MIPSPKAINPHPTLGDVVGTFKSLVFATYLDWIQANDPSRRAKFWQRNYFEHVVRNEDDLHAIRSYICQNLDSLALDRDHPMSLRHPASPKRAKSYLHEALMGEGNGMV